MNKKDFLSQYQDKRWYELSKRVKARDKNICQMCGRNDIPVSVHHKIYYSDRKVWEYSDNDLICICDRCHENLTDTGRNLYNDFKCLRNRLRELGFSDNILSGIFYRFLSVLDSIIDNEDVNDFDTINFLVGVVHETQDYADLKALKILGIDESEFIKYSYPHLLNDYILNK